MQSFTTKQLRSQMAYFIDLLIKGEPVELTYHSKKVVIENKQAINQTKPSIEEALVKLGKYKIDKKYQEAEDFKELMNKHYDQKDFVS
jgi:hypothetical protein